MGRLKQLMIEHEENQRLQRRDATQSDRALNFDSDNYQDNDWWRQQDEELVFDELLQIMSQADIEDERLGGCYD